MLHARVIGPRAVGAKLVSVDEASIKDIPGAKVVRVKDLLAVVADDEWNAVRASRALRAQWSEGTGLPSQSGLVESLRNEPGIVDETLVKQGKPCRTAAGRRKSPHRDLLLADAEPRIDRPVLRRRRRECRFSATIWTASQGTHGNQRRLSPDSSACPKEKVRLIYLEGSGCYGMNGHEDAAADAAILSRAIGRPVRVQWTREDEHGWDPKGPPQLLDVSGAVSADGRIRGLAHRDVDSEDDARACRIFRCWRPRRPVSNTCRD